MICFVLPPARSLALTALLGLVCLPIHAQMGAEVTPAKVQAALPQLEKLAHYAYTNFGFTAAGLSGVTFTVGPDQKAQQVVIENLNLQGLGVFTRVPIRK